MTIGRNPAQFGSQQPIVELFSPTSGVTPAQQWGRGAHQFLVTASGAHVLKVHDDDQADAVAYGLEYNWVQGGESGCREDLDCGNNLQRNVPLGGQDVYELNAEAGDILSVAIGRFSAQFGSQQPVLDLFAPGDVNPIATLSQGLAQLALSKSGTYVFRVHDDEMSDGVTYGLTYNWLHPAARACRPQLGCGMRIETSVALGGQDVYEFQGLKSDILTVALGRHPAQFGTQQPIADLIGPTGDGVPLESYGPGTYQFEIPMDGPYILRVHDDDMGDGVAYSLSYAWINRLCNCAEVTEKVPGDCNQDCVLDLSDAVCLFGFLFLGVPDRLPCGKSERRDPGNINLLDWQSDGEIDISDGVVCLNFLFLGEAAHPLAVVGNESTGKVVVEGCP